MCGLLFKLNSSSFIVFNMNQTCLPIRDKSRAKDYLHFIHDPHRLSHTYKSCVFFYCGDKNHLLNKKTMNLTSWTKGKGTIVWDTDP